MRFVKIIEIEDKVSLRVANNPKMSRWQTPASLNVESGCGHPGHVVRHQRGRATEEAEWTPQHPSVANRDPFRNTNLIGLFPDSDRVSIRVPLPFGVDFWWEI